MALVSKSAAAVRTPTPMAAPKPPAANPFAAAVVTRPGVAAQPVAPQLNQNVSSILAQQQAARDAVARQQAAQAQAAAQAQQAQMAQRQQQAAQQAAQAQLAQQNALQAHLDQVTRDTAVRQQAATAAAQQQAAQQAAARASAQQAAQAQAAEQIRAANAAYAAQQAAKTAPVQQPVPQPVPQPVQQTPVPQSIQVPTNIAQVSPVGGGQNWVQHNPDGSFTNYLGTFKNQLDFQKAALPGYIQQYNQSGGQIIDPTQQFSDLYKSNPELFQSMKVNQQAAQTPAIDWTKYATGLDKNIFDNGAQYGMGLNTHGNLVGLDANGNPVYQGQRGATYVQDPNGPYQMVPLPGVQQGGYFDQSGNYLGFGNQGDFVKTQYTPPAPNPIPPPPAMNSQTAQTNTGIMALAPQPAPPGRIQVDSPYIAKGI